MKNKITFLLIVFLCFLSNGLFAQSANNEQRIIGTWTAIISTGEGSSSYANSVWIFNSNGTVIINYSGNRESLKYVVIGSKMIVENFGLFDIDISTDGRTIILSSNTWGYGFALRKN